MSEKQVLQEGVAVSNSDFTTASVIAIRLNTDELLQKIEYFLRGKEVNFYTNAEGITKAQLDDSGIPKANKRGIQSILNKCRAIINAQTVQGNYKEDFYFQAIREIRIDIAHDCFCNRYRWELENDYSIKEIPDTIMAIVEPFLSRLIGNKERESYSQSMQSKQVNTLNDSKGLDLFKKN
jgi:hypothetical protein